MVKLGIAVIAEEDWRVRIAAGQAPPRVALIFVAADGASDDVDDAAATAQLQDSIKVDHYPCCIRLVPACTLVGVIDRIDTTQCVHDLHVALPPTHSLPDRSIALHHFPVTGPRGVTLLSLRSRLSGPGHWQQRRSRRKEPTVSDFFGGFFDEILPRTQRL